MSGAAIPGAPDGLRALAETLALAAFETAAEGEAPADLFQPLLDWLAAAPDLALARLSDGFDLAPVETAVLALLFALAISEPAARAAAAAEAGAGGIPGPGVPLWLLSRAVPGFGVPHLSAVGALIRFAMVEPAGAPEPRIAARLRLAAPLVDRCLGLAARDPALAARVTPLEAQPQPGPLAEALTVGLSVRGPLGLPPLVATPGAEPAAVAGALATLGLAGWAIDAADLPADPGEREAFAAVLAREAALDDAAVILTGEHPHLAAFADRLAGQVIATAATAPHPHRGLHLIPAEPDAPARTVARWQAALGPERAARLGPGLERIAARFRLPPADMAAAVARAGARIDRAGLPAEAEAALWHAAARAHPDPQLPGVRLVEPGFGWDDIVLPPQVEVTLRRIESHVRHAAQVFDDWGFAARMGGAGSWRGRGVAALFSGPPGTGKTMAAEIIARSLDLRVLSIDMSQIVSKWIGETSKNVASAFEAAERSGAVMLWNEGDGIWGARGGVGNATDRHVNAEVGDLLQRIEEFSGFTVVTTNLRHAIDPAFLRRFRFSVEFPAPSSDERLRLWARAFPAETPVEPMDWSALAALPLSGGSIRNVALGAAFMAAEAGTRVTREMLAEELAAEMKKHGQQVPRIDWGARA